MSSAFLSAAFPALSVSSLIHYAMNIPKPIQQKASGDVSTRGPKVAAKLLTPTQPLTTTPLATVTLPVTAPVAAVAAITVAATQPLTAPVPALTAPLTQPVASEPNAEASNANNTLFLPVILQNSNLAGTVLGSTAGRITVFLLLVGVVVGGRLFRRLRKRK